MDEINNATDKLDIAIEAPLSVNVGGVMKDVTSYKGVYNVSSGQFCCSVINDYNVVQHKEYFTTFAQALTRLGIKFNMNIQQFNHKAMADIEFTGRNIKFDKLDEEFTTGIRLINSYDKSTGLSVAPRYTRLACTNGMVVTRNDEVFSITHRSKLLKEMESYAEKKISDIINTSFELQRWISTSMKDNIEWKTCCGIIEKLVHEIKHREEILKRLGISIIQNVENKNKDEKKKKIISYVWDDERNVKEKLNRWDIYNAITSYCSHGEHLSPNIEIALQRKAQKLLYTPLEKMPMVEVKL